eukprot:366380-Chlamydomonas_euryale.AAC.4
MLAETVRMGFDREQLVESIRSRAQNKATVTYYLMCDNRRPGHGQYLRSELSEAQGTLAPQPTSSSHVAGLPASAPVAAPQQRLMAERRWRLGVHARGHPSALMAELYRLLQVWTHLVWAWLEGKGVRAGARGGGLHERERRHAHGQAWRGGRQHASTGGI